MPTLPAAFAELEPFVDWALPSEADRYAKRFGSIDCGKAMAELERRGYTLTDKWEWIAPLAHVPTEEELFWIGFLVDDWDFGGLIPLRPGR